MAEFINKTILKFLGSILLWLRNLVEKRFRQGKVSLASLLEFVSIFQFSKLFGSFYEKEQLFCQVCIPRFEYMLWKPSLLSLQRFSCRLLLIILVPTQIHGLQKIVLCLEAEKKMLLCCVSSTANLRDFTGRRDDFILKQKIFQLFVLIHPATCKYGVAECETK